MGAVKQFRFSASLRTKGYELLTRYEPSDLAFTLGASFYDRMNKAKTALAVAHSKDQAKELQKKISQYKRAAMKLIATAKTLKMMEM